MRRLACSILALAAVLAGAPAASAQDPIALFRRAKELENAGKWEEACGVYAEAHRLQKDAVGITLNLAGCYAHIGKTASAWSTYQAAEFLCKKDHDDERARYAHDEGAKLEPRLSTLQINTAATPGLIIHHDDQEVGKGILGVAFPVDPGVHTIEATAPGYLVWSTTVKIGAERDKQVIEIPILQRASGFSLSGDGGSVRPQRVAGLAVGGAGVVGLAVGAAFGGLALKKASDLKSGGQCNAALTVCTMSGLSLREDLQTSAHVSTAALAVGGAAVVVGVVLFVTAPPGGAAPGPASGFRASVGPIAGAEMNGLWMRGEW